MTVEDGSAPRLRMPAPDADSARIGRRPGRSGLLRVAAPIAAAAALAGLAAGIAAIRAGSVPVRDDKPGPTAVRQAGRVLAGVPRYFVALTPENFSPYHPSPLVAVVRATASGKTLATIRVPRHGYTFAAVTGAADDLTYVLAAHRMPSRFGIPAMGPVSFYTLRFNPERHSALLTRLAIPGLPGSPLGSPLITGIALSPDGTRLAVAYQPATASAQTAGRQSIRVYTLTKSPAVRTWSSDGWMGFAGGYPSSVSWARGDEVLAFDWSASDDCQGGTSSVRLLNLSSSGGSLIADSTLGASAGRYRCFAGDSVITTDGKTIIGLIAGLDHRSNLGYVRFAEYSASTHRLIGFKRQHYGLPGGWLAYILWSDATGHALIVHATTGPGLSLLPLIFPAAIAGDRSARIQLPAMTAGAAW